MALVLKDRVKETTTTTGTGTITLAGAVTGYQAFSAIGNANTTYYCISGGSEWEVGIGTYTSSGTTLSRDTILASSNSGSAVNFSAGTKDVFVVYPAGKAVYGVIDPANLNVVIGDNTFTANTTGTDNVGVGSYALNANTTGSSNVAVGTYTLISNTTGVDNVAIGWDALADNTTGGSNTAVGSDTLVANTASNNTALGSAALYTNTTGTPNVAVGYQSLYANTTGADNVAVGASALGANTTGDENVSIGSNSLTSNTTGYANTACGGYALNANVTGVYNTGIGDGALYLNTGDNNTSIGGLALFNNTTASYNVAVGSAALYSNTTGTPNVAVGYQALYSNTTGASNSAVGYQALRFNTTASFGTAVGDDALYSNTTGASNTAVGEAALYTNTTGYQNIAAARGALFSNTTGYQNTAVGSNALYDNSAGFQNTAVGASALYSNTTGDLNVANGYFALRLNTTGNNNTALGSLALDANEASSNTAVGYSSGSAITTGSKNVVLGSYTGNQGGLDIRTSSNNIVLSDGDGNVRTYINSSGNVGIGTNSPTQKLDVNGYIAVNSNNISADNSLGFRNRIINGGFGVAQRGTSFVSGANDDDTYNLDRWYVLSDGNDAVDITQATTVPTGAKYSIGLDVETTNKKFGIAQIIENANCFDAIGGTVTLSFQARVSATTKLDNVKCAIVAWSGTADSVTSDIISAWNVEGTNPTLIANATYENTPANLNVTTSWATYSVSAAVDTASAANIIVFIWSDVTDTTLGNFLYITNVQLEVGSVATPFERRPYGTELALCQRYAVSTFPSGTAWGQNAGQTGSLETIASASTRANIQWQLPVTMRAQPTVTSYNPSAANSSFRNISASSDAAATINTAQQQGVNVMTTSAGATDNRYLIHLSATAEL